MQSLRLHQGFFWVACLLALLVLTVTTPTAQANEGLDIDQDGSEAPLTDGLLIIRHLFGFTGTALSQGATGSDAQRTDPSAITQYLNDNLDTLDIDASGDVTPLTDGLLIIRHLFGFTGTALTQGAVSSAGTRQSSEDIGTYLASIATNQGTSGGNGNTGSGNGEGGNTDNGAGGSGGSDNSAKTYFNDEVSDVILNRCYVCHNGSGSAQGTRLVYLSKTDTAYLSENFETLKDYIAGTATTAPAGAKLLNKARGVGHGGGTVLSSTSAGYAILEQFVDLVEAEAGISSSGKAPDTASGEGFFKSTVLLNSKETLRRASMLLLGRNPSAREYDLLTGEDINGLRLALREVTQAPEFHQFLTRAANDRLLTDAFLEGMPLEQSNIEGNANYPIATNAFVEAQAQAEERFFRWPKYNHWRWGLTRAPVELIAYIVGNDRDYREVLTADYMMMNYAVNDFLNGGADFSTSNDEALLDFCEQFPNEACYDHRIFKPGYHRGQVPLDEFIEEEETDFQSKKITNHSDFINYPHAGVLNTQAFLNRYPSTETNRNRARARWTFYHFLGVDIEKSAPRTTDPAALADSNNPTLRNPACTVCHQVLDPLAGAFERYGDVGYYNESWGGMDALPDNYKSVPGDPTLSSSHINGETIEVANTAFETVSNLSAMLEPGTLYVQVSFNNDEGGPDGDRNAFYDALNIIGPATTSIVEFESLPAQTITIGCGGPEQNGYAQWCSGKIIFPVTIQESGLHRFELVAKGDQYGSKAVELTIALDGSLENLVSLGYQPGDTWYQDMRDPGFLSTSAPEDTDSLQWAAAAMVEDPWFAEAAVKFWWPALMGGNVAVAPEVESDADFTTRLALFEAQNDFIETLGADFARGIAGRPAFNGRDLIVELLLSPWFRAASSNEAQAPVGDAGTRRLLTPEELEAKFFHLSDFYWGSDGHFSEWQFDTRYSFLTDDLNVLYGGIDARNVTRRADNMSSIMFNIAEKMALSSACEIVSREFDLPSGERRLFTEIEATTTPTTRVLESQSLAVANSDLQTVLNVTQEIEAGSKAIIVSFTNDFYSETEGNRDAHLDRIEITQPDGQVTTIEFETAPEGTQVYGCGNANDQYFNLACNGTVIIPFDLMQSGLHTFALVAAGEQAGDAPVQITFELLETSESEELGKPQLLAQVEALHWKLLGESVTQDPIERDATFALLIEDLKLQQSQNKNGLKNWPDETCNNHNWRSAPLNTTDPTGMKSAWVTVLTYLMTDFKFLHE